MPHNGKKMVVGALYKEPLCGRRGFGPACCNITGFCQFLVNWLYRMETAGIVLKLMICPHIFFIISVSRCCHFEDKTVIWKSLIHIGLKKRD